MARHALAGEPDELPRMHAGRNLDAERACLEGGPALRVELLRAQRDLALGTVERILERDLDGRMVVFAACAVVAPCGAAPFGLTEQRRKELA
jgi:hypothetical protein